jgi:hypothetical protein
MTTQKLLTQKAQKLCRKFYDDAQRLFDDDGMTQELADSPVFAALLGAQGYAEEAADESAP